MVSTAQRRLARAGRAEPNGSLSLRGRVGQQRQRPSDDGCLGLRLPFPGRGLPKTGRWISTSCTVSSDRTSFSCTRLARAGPAKACLPVTRPWSTRRQELVYRFGLQGATGRRVVLGRACTVSLKLPVGAMTPPDVGCTPSSTPAPRRYRPTGTWCRHTAG